MRLIYGMLLLIVGGLAGFGIARFTPANEPPVTPVMATPVPKPLLAYSFDNLAGYRPEASVIRLETAMATHSGATAHLASYTTGGKRMTMQVMVPDTATPSAGFPVLLMIRGFVDASTYQTGIGTKNAARYFASGGFVTVAPDFLGYGGSDPPASDTIEARLERPRQLLDLIASLPSLPFTSPDKLGIWGHSNGGQIALSLLEITGKPLPTVLWAPVTKPFPYSILYYTDESDDGGKELRKVLANFEKGYDVYQYSLDKYLNRINAPVALHQGTADQAVPVAWSTAFVTSMEELDKDVSYFTYPGADHNLQPAWQTAAARSLEFFLKHIVGKEE